jgi:hypothetical protein
MKNKFYIYWHWEGACSVVDLWRACFFNIYEKLKLDIEVKREKNDSEIWRPACQQPQLSITKSALLNPRLWYVCFSLSDLYIVTVFLIPYLTFILYIIKTMKVTNSLNLSLIVAYNINSQIKFSSKFFRVEILRKDAWRQIAHKLI